MKKVSQKERMSEKPYKITLEQEEAIDKIMPRFKKLEKKLLDQLETDEKNKKIKFIPTTNKEKYYEQNLFDLNSSLNHDNPVYVLIEKDTNKLLETNFPYFFKKETPEFKEMCAILDKVGTDIYAYLQMSKPLK